jgi:tRNA threonylcarbamoyladenosine biosynthesis protein TsaE
MTVRSEPAGDEAATRQLDLETHSAAETQELGARLARLLQPGDVIALQGELGTGKTCLTQGIGRGLGVAEPVVSPTFTLIREYRRRGVRLPLYHIDFYRLDEPAEAAALGLDDYLYGDGVCVIEWAERAREVLPAERLWVQLEYRGETERTLYFDATDQRYEKLLAAFAKD